MVESEKSAHTLILRWWFFLLLFLVHYVALRIKLYLLGLFGPCCASSLAPAHEYNTIILRATNESYGLKVSWVRFCCSHKWNKPNKHARVRRTEMARQEVHTPDAQWVFLPASFRYYYSRIRWLLPLSPFHTRKCRRKYVFTGGFDVFGGKRQKYCSFTAYPTHFVNRYSSAGAILFPMHGYLSCASFVTPCAAICMEQVPEPEITMQCGGVSVVCAQLGFVGAFDTLLHELLNF